MKRITKKPTLKKNIIIAVVIILLGAVGAGTYFYFKPKEPTEKTGINYNPPTNNEIQEAVDQQEKNKQREALDANPPTVTSADVVIADAAQYGDTIEVRGFIQNVYEDGGTCTAVLKKGELSVTKSNPAFKDAKTIQCGALDFKRTQFTQSGTWELTLTYNSAVVEGSATKSVEVK
jgi:cytoskeletal protein RodZ